MAEARGSGRLQPGKAVVLGAVLYSTVLLGAPLAALGIGAWTHGPTALLQAITSEGAYGAFGRTLILAAIAVVVNGAFGVAAALVLVRRSFRGRAALDMLIDLPLGVSPVMIGLGFLLLTGRDGLVTPLLDAIGVRVPFAFPGLVVATLFVTLPFTAREVGHLLEELGTNEEDAAATLGASPTRTFCYVTLPNILPALSTGVVLTAARALGEFGAVLILGGAVAGSTDTATTFLYASLEERREAGVVGVSLVLVACSVLVLAATKGLQTSRRRGRSP